MINMMTHLIMLIRESATAPSSRSIQQFMIIHSHTYTQAHSDMHSYAVHMNMSEGDRSVTTSAYYDDQWSLICNIRLCLTQLRTLYWQPGWSVPHDPTTRIYNIHDCRRDLCASTAISWCSDPHHAAWLYVTECMILWPYMNIISNMIINTGVPTKGLSLLLR